MYLRTRLDNEGVESIHFFFPDWLLQVSNLHEDSAFAPIFEQTAPIFGFGAELAIVVEPSETHRATVSAIANLLFLFIFPHKAFVIT